MIIDDNNNNFVKPMPKINSNANPSPMPYKNSNPVRPTMLTDNMAKSINPLNSDDMSNQALTILKQRYEGGLISIDEFKRGCERIKNNR